MYYFSLTSLESLETLGYSLEFEMMLCGFEESSSTTTLIQNDKATGSSVELKKGNATNKTCEPKSILKQSAENNQEIMFKLI